jgi:acetylornithine/succinyldiaminopimelate/putrescine aminotransferase
MINLKKAFIISQEKNIKLYKSYINPGLSRAYSILGYNNFEIVEASGSWLKLKNKKKILDLTSSLGVNNLGHNNKDIIKAENFFSSKNYIDCQKFGVNKLQSVLAYNLKKILNNNLSLSFFGTSGAEANEAGLKLAMAYHKGKRKKFVTFNNSYHGKTLNSLALTNVRDFQDSFILGLDKKNIINLKFNDVVSLEKIITQDHGDINAIIIEPIQGQTMEVVSIPFMKKIDEMCRKYKILLFLDEIKCGLSRAREIFYYKNFGVKADILTISKSLGGGKNAISAMICDDKIFKKAYGSINRSNIHTTTFFGMGKSCATAIQTLEILSDKKFQNELNEKAIFIKKKFYLLKDKYPNFVKNIKGDGLFLGIELNLNNFIPLQLKVNISNSVNSIIMASIIRYLLEKYHLLLHFEKTNPSIIKFMPCLNINKKEINFFFKNFDHFLQSSKQKIFLNFIYKNIKNINQLF